MEYVDEDWPNQFWSKLIQKSKLNWSITYDTRRGFQAPISWRSGKFFRSYNQWEISCEVGFFGLTLSFREKDGAIKTKKGIQPVLILEHNTSSPPVLFKKVYRTPHKKVDGKEIGRGAVSSFHAPGYNLKPHIDDLVDKILEVVNGSDLLNSVYSVDGVPMLGLEIVNTHNQGAVYALYEALEEGDVALIDNQIVVELLGSPKKASVVRVATKALLKSGLERAKA
jgi:hypothetical protein